MTTLDQDITDYASGVFLRYFRKGILAGAKEPNVNLTHDINFLRAHWAISKPVRDFLSYLLSHPHEVQSLLQIDRRMDDTMARGRIDARNTILARRISGHPSLIVSEEQIRSFNTGPNHIVGWVVHMVASHASRFSRFQSAESTYGDLVEAVMSQIAAVKRLEVLRVPLKHMATKNRRRPQPWALTEAARSRRAVYGHAIAAYNTLRGIEVGDEEALLRVLQSTLIAPLEQWRRFELAVAVGIGEALADETDEEMQISILGSLSGQPIIRCGHFDIYWQSTTSLFSPPSLEPSEKRLEKVLAPYGINLGVDRPDLVMVDREANMVVSIVEVKYLTGDTMAARFREAAAQVVRYARGYSCPASIDNLIHRSLIALSAGAPDILYKTAPSLRAVDFLAMQKGALREWVRERLISQSH